MMRTSQTPTITLQPVTRANWRQTLTLTVDAEQQRFVAGISPPAAVALAKAYIRPQGIPVSPYAICADEVMVGYFNLVNDPDSTDNYWLYHFFIDRRFQGRGYGRAALRAILALLQNDFPRCRSVSLMVHPENTVAQRLYTGAGFRATGAVNEDEGGEPIYRLELAGEGDPGQNPTAVNRN
jgi:diamine N-acetyltransferase